MPKISEVSCPDERAILQTLSWAVQVMNGYSPFDTPALIVALANHRRECPFCDGTALQQLFGQRVVVEDVKHG